MSYFALNCDTEAECNADRKGGFRVHFVGVGGIGMCALFRLSESMGICVTGSDREAGEMMRELMREGKAVTVGHSRDNVKGASAVVYTLAADAENPELAYARAAGIPTLSRAEYFGILMRGWRERIGVSGTHGKSTVTAMLNAIYETAGEEPTTLLGAPIPKSRSPLRLGARRWLIYEACEYKDAFLSFSPTATVFTNLELDHVDYFRNTEALKRSFLRAMDNSPLCIVNADDGNLRELLPHTVSRTVTFGESMGVDYRADIFERSDGFYSLEIHRKNARPLHIDLSVAGRFNALNAAGAAALASTLGIADAHTERALSEFSGVARRIERIGERGGVPVYYDYAHHPTEIECTVKTVKEMCHGGVTVIFKPHTYSRTAGLMEGFVRSLSTAEKVILLEISGIREAAIEGVSSKHLAELIGDTAVFAENEELALREADAARNSAVIIMGAANMDGIKRLIIGK